MLKRLLFIVSFVLNAFLASAQTFYPVQIQPTVITPSIYLQDYVDQSNFRVKVSLNDITKQNFQVRIKMTISKGTAVKATSKDGIILTLDGGQVYFLSDQDLADLFNPSDLGLTPTSTLDEGAYMFSFEATTAFDESVKVSNKAIDFTQSIIVLNDPPLLNLPIKGSEVDMSQLGSSLQFSWMPRSFFTSPNRKVKYEIKIVKVSPVDVNPFQAIQSEDAFVQLSQDGLEYPQLTYDPSYLAFESGSVYAWRIRAYEEIIGGDGKIEKLAARFKNDGYSEVQTFSTKDVCPVVKFNPVTGTSPLVLSWYTEGTGTVNQYEIQYREQGTTLPYTIIRQTENTLSLDNTQVQEGVTYEYNVAVLCNKWISPVYGGTFKLAAPDCAPPSPIRIGDPNSKGDMVFLWDAPANKPSVTGYKFTYSKGTDAEVIENLTDKTFSLPPLLDGEYYQIQVDGVCGDIVAAGKKQKVNKDDNGFVGTCPIPAPFLLYANRVEGTTTKEAKISFSNTNLHQAYSIKYWLNTEDSTKALIANITTPVPEIVLPNIIDEQLYQYRVTFDCGSGKLNKTGIGMFKVAPASNLDPNITPNTANCFPPAQIAAEARSTTSAKFDWAKNGANEYQLLYRVAGSTANFEVFNTTATEAKINNLQESKIYEYKIKCRCGTAYSIESALGTVDLSKPTINDKCDTIAFVKALKTTKTEVQLAWKYVSGATSTFTIFYKEEAQGWGDQYVEELQDLTSLIANNVSNDTMRYTITKLKSGTKYNFKVQKVCGIEKAQINEVVSATTLVDATKSECGSGKACDRTSTTPIASIQKDDVIQVADYKLKILEIEAVGSNPVKYKGKGIAEAPFIGMSDHLELEAEFEDLEVNDKACVLKGNIEFSEARLQLLDAATRDQIKNTMNVVQTGLETVKDGLNTATDALNQASDALNTALDYTQGGGDVGKVKDGGFTPDYTTTSTSAPTSADAPNKPALVQNASGEVYQVDKNGNVTKVGVFNDAYKDLHTKSIETVSGVSFGFKANSSATWPYDAFIEGYKVATMKSHYLLKGTTYCDAKLILPKELDKVDFTFSGGAISNLKFVNRKGFVYDYNTTTNTINLVGGPASDAQEIMAVYDDGGTKKVIGAILLPSYEPKEKKVVLVNTFVSKTLAATATDIQTELNKIYKKVGVNYTVTIDNSFVDNIDWFGTPNQLYFNGGKNTALGNEYSEDAQRMQEAYIKAKGADNLDKTAAYLFMVIPDPQSGTSDEGLDGKMHFGKQFGFLYNTKSLAASKIATTLAHELGHGNFLMYHIFDNIYLGDGAKTGDNLMAYGNGVKLNKLQWDLIHDPGVNWGIFVGEKDQQKGKQDYSKLLPTYTPNVAGWYLSFSGKPVYLPLGHRIAATLKCGALVAFELQNGASYDLYRAVFSQGVFQGYSNGTTMYSPTAVFNEKTDDIYVISDFTEIVDDKGVTLKYPVMAQFVPNKMKIFDPSDVSSNRNNVIAYQIKSTVKNPDSWETFALKSFNTVKPHIFENKFFYLKPTLQNSCSGIYTSEFNTLTIMLRSQFNDVTVDKYTFPRLDGISSYNGIATASYITTVSGSAPATQSKLYVTYAGKDYYSNQTIYIPEGGKIKPTDQFSFELKGMTATDVKFSFTSNVNNASKIDESTVNPTVYTNGKISSKVYGFDAKSGTDEYTNFIVGVDLFLTYLNSTADIGTTVLKTPLVNNPDYNLTIGAGNNVYLKYLTSIPTLEPITAKNETDVKFYLENLDGTSSQLISSAGFGTSGSFNTASGIGNPSATAIEYRYIVIKLILKSSGEVLCTKKVKLKIVPLETITYIKVVDKAKYAGRYEKCSEYDKEVGRYAENGEILYVVVNPECETSSTTKNFDFEIRCSLNNLNKLPVVWNFKSQEFQNVSNYSPSSPKQFSIIKGLGTAMKINQNFTTQLSGISNAIDISPFKVKIPGIGIDIDFNNTELLKSATRRLHNVGNLSLIGEASIFGSKKYANIVFVHNSRDELQFDLSSLKLPTNSKLVKVFDKIDRITKFIPSVKAQFEKIPFIKKNPGFKVNSGKFSPVYKYYFKEKSNSRLYQSVHELELTYSGASISYTKDIDFTDKLPPYISRTIAAIDYAAQWVGTTAELKVGCKISISFGADLSYNPTWTFDQGDGTISSTPVETNAFEGTFVLGVGAIPNVTFNISDYSAALAGELKFEAEAPITYDITNNDVNWKLETNPLKFTPSFKFKDLETGEDIIDTSIEFELTEKITWYDSSNP